MHAPQKVTGAEVPVELERLVRDLVMKDRSIAAVAEVRKQLGWGLREAKAYVDSIRDGMKSQ